MGENSKSFIIALGLVMLFLTGALAGYSTGHSEFWNIAGDSPWRLQWEVLLTGLAAICGGYMAYNGATLPHKLAKRQAATRHYIDIKSCARQIIFFESETKEDIERAFALGAVYHNVTEDDYIRKLSRHILANMPEIPDQIFSIEVHDKRQSLRQFLAMSSIRRSRDPYFLVEARQQALEYLKAINEHA